MRLALALLAAAWPMAPAATVLYKSVDGNGVVMFSDTPPPEGARILEERHIVSRSGDFPPPPPAAAADPALNEALLDSDAILASANAKLDEAERALAEARRAAGPILGPLRLAASRLTSEDEERIEKHKREVRMARQRLLEILRERRLALVRN